MASSRESVQVYLLGVHDFAPILRLQHRLVFDVAGGSAPALLLCEHPPLVTVGREGSYGHISPTAEGLEAAGIRWVNRGGGCWWQQPGQLAVYPIVPLRRLGLTLQDYLRLLTESLAATVRDHGLQADVLRQPPCLTVGGRPIACLGAAVCQWTTYFGAVLNINPLLEAYWHVRTGQRHPPMTSLSRECRFRVRPAEVRERLVHHFVAQFGFDEAHIYTDHPLLRGGGKSHAFTATR